MIRFACPGCSSVFTVPDEKGGKTGKCPKCQSQFLIPDAEPAAVSPPPPPPRPRPPSTAAAKAPPPAPVEIAPCPKCQARLSVMASDLGSDIECPHCKAVYTAVRPGATAAAAAPPPPLKSSSVGAALSGATRSKSESRRSRDDDDNDDRPRSRSRRRDDDDNETEDEDDRPRRRRHRDDEDDRPRRRTKPINGLLIALAVVHFVYVALNWIAGALTLKILNVISAQVEFIKGMNQLQRGNRVFNPNMPQADPRIQADTDTIEILYYLLVLGCILHMLQGVLSLLGGIGCLLRKKWGQTVGYVTAGLASFMVLASVGLEIYFWAGVPSVIRLFVAILLGGGYAGFTMFVLNDRKASAQFQ
ncbi:MAG: hypothetical protein ACRC7O_18795 [Fimbriiglobus sp.]